MADSLTVATPPTASSSGMSHAVFGTKSDMAAAKVHTACEMARRHAARARLRGEWRRARRHAQANNRQLADAGSGGTAVTAETSATSASSTPKGASRSKTLLSAIALLGGWL
eukprot:3330592-Pleurochrysis_carterae.AAC.2